MRIYTAVIGSRRLPCRAAARGSFCGLASPSRGTEAEAIRGRPEPHRFGLTRLGVKRDGSATIVAMRHMAAAAETDEIEAFAWMTAPSGTHTIEW